MDNKYLKREYLPGYTGYVPKKMGTYGVTVGEVNRRLVVGEKSDDIPGDVKRDLYLTAKGLPIDKAKDTLKYGPNSKAATTWIGGSTEKIYPQYIPGYEGHVPGIKAENIFGESYAKITKKAILGEVSKGTDLDPKQKYMSYYNAQHNETQHRRYFENPTILKSKKDQEHYNQYVDSKARTTSPLITSNPLVANIPTVGYMGHKPLYRKPIVNIGAQEGQHFDLTTTKAAFEAETVKGLSQGFATVIKPEEDKKLPIAGYRGFMPGMKARNFHGKAFRECAANSLKVLETVKTQ